MRKTWRIPRSSGIFIGSFIVIHGSRHRRRNRPIPLTIPAVRAVPLLLQPDRVQSGPVCREPFKLESSPSQIAYSIDNRPEIRSNWLLTTRPASSTSFPSPIGKFQFNYPRHQLLRRLRRACDHSLRRPQENGVDISLLQQLLQQPYCRVPGRRGAARSSAADATITLKCDNAGEAVASILTRDCGMSALEELLLANMGNIVPNGVSITNAYASYLKGASSFGATGYSFTSQGCTAGSLVGTPVYLTVTAANQNGVSTNVLVQISTTGCTTTTTATSTSTTQHRPDDVSRQFSQNNLFHNAGDMCSVDTRCYHGHERGELFHQRWEQRRVLHQFSRCSLCNNFTSRGDLQPGCDCLHQCRRLRFSSRYRDRLILCHPPPPPPPSSTTTAATTGTPVFTQPGGYTMATTTCTAGSAVGAVFATNAITYNINNGSTIFTIDSSGNITLTSATTAGTYNTQVTAFSATGATTTVPVTITVQCAAG
ncbi:hypothetical protein BV898_02985 [Hypsibius exemplaris]|uniref:Cadherin domain-containing protein n=1 Tax=Hypsibius exemplaris TaxID=2072580 RepID=A0A1W0X6B5_HYPEX|nr:hypothetical protein BV898_02985 [Hypsibius exemplaris]